MAYIVSPALGMSLADPTTIQNFETPVVNNNFLALENGIVADRVRLTTLEALPPALAAPTLYARGQLADYLVVDLAALDAVSTAVIGDTAWMTTPGTGIDSLRWKAIAGAGAGLDWVPDEMVIADTKAHLDTFIAAVAAVADTRFKVGSLAQAEDTDLFYRFTSTAGAYSTFLAQLGNIVDQDSVNVATINSGANGSTITTKAFASLPYATTVILEADAKMGFNGAAMQNAIGIGASAGTLTQPTARQVQSNGGQWCTVVQRAKLVIPANTAATVTFTISASANSYVDFAFDYRRVTS